MMHLDRTVGQLLPITIGHECEIVLMNNRGGHWLQQCLSQAYYDWVQPEHDRHRNDASHSHSGDGMPERNTCCYQWTVLQCVTDAVADSCGHLSEFHSG